MLGRFHVIRWFCAGLTAVRRDVQRRPDGTKPVFDPEVFKARFALMRRGDTLTEADQARLDTLFDATVLTIAWEKQSESNAMWALSLPQPFTTSVNAGAGGYFSPIMRRYMAMSDAPELIGCLVAFKDRQHALKNPYAHLHQHDLTFEQVVESPMLWDPIRYSETCPSSDGACAMVLTDEAGGDAHDGPVAWVKGTAMRSESNSYGGRNMVSPAASEQCADDVFAQAGIGDRRKQIDAVEMYVPFSWYEPMWLESLGFAEKGRGWQLVESGATKLEGGDLPVNCSGGVLSSNAIGASGMIRFAEAALQVMGEAGRASSRRRAHGFRSRLRRRRPVLRNVDRRQRQVAPAPCRRVSLESGR